MAIQRASRRSEVRGRNQTRISKPEIQTNRKSECPKRKHVVAASVRRTVADFGPSDFVIVSDFGLLISDFKRMRAPCADFDCLQCSEVLGPPTGALLI